MERRQNVRLILRPYKSPIFQLPNCTPHMPTEVREMFAHMAWNILWRKFVWPSVGRKIFLCMRHSILISQFFSKPHWIFLSHEKNSTTFYNLYVLVAKDGLPVNKIIRKWSASLCIIIFKIVLVFRSTLAQKRKAVKYSVSRRNLINWNEMKRLAGQAFKKVWYMYETW